MSIVTTENLGLFVIQHYRGNHCNCVILLQWKPNSYSYLVLPYLLLHLVPSVYLGHISGISSHLSSSRTTITLAQAMATLPGPLQSLPPGRTPPLWPLGIQLSTLQPDALWKRPTLFIYLFACLFGFGHALRLAGS